MLAINETLKKIAIIESSEKEEEEKRRTKENKSKSL